MLKIILFSLLSVLTLKAQDTVKDTVAVNTPFYNGKQIGFGFAMAF